MRVNVAIPEAHVSKPVLDAALEAVTRLNEQLIRKGDSPTSHQLISAGAIWKPEPPGQEHFDHGGIIAKRGDGDCDDWAPLHAATLRVTGHDPGARAVVRKSGPKRWHATVIRSDGSEDDPSLAAGMPGPARTVGIRGAWMPFMPGRAGHGVNGAFINTPQLALRPLSDSHGEIESWQARADLPWHWRPTGAANPSDVAMVTLHRSPVSSTAICGAVRGAFQIGLANGADPEQLKRLSALQEMCEGASWEDVAERYGAEHATAAGAIVGSFFGKAFRSLKKVVKKVAAPIAKGALSFVPGGGLASAALSMASPALKKSVAKQKHAPPQLRAAALPPPRAAAPAAALPRPPGVPQQTPVIVNVYPPPAAGGASSGVAWPPAGG